jgi:ABC-type transport system involved in multi-copper enzyme maturation permease subunit
MNFRIMAAIAGQTFKSFVRDKIFYSTLIFSVLFICFTLFLSTLTIVEEKKILLDFGLAAISIVGVVLSFFLGVTVIGSEMDKRTIYVVLSKPVRRGEYLVGKFLGAFLVSLVVHLLNAVTLMIVIFWAGETLPPGFWATIYLMVLESAVLIAISILFSLSTSSIALASSLAIASFLIGRSNHMFRVFAEKTDSAITRILVKVLGAVFPSLDRFDIREVVAYSKPYPPEMIPVSSGYFVLYLTMVLLVAYLVFRRKDLT